MILGWLEEADNVTVLLPATCWITEVIGLIFVGRTTNRHWEPANWRSFSRTATSLRRRKKSIWFQKTYDDLGAQFETEPAV